MSGCIRMSTEQTRKPSCCKGKHAKAMHVWRPRAMKSTGNQQYVISYWWLTVTVAVLLTTHLWDIFVHRDSKSPFSCTAFELIPSARMPSNINVIWTGVTTLVTENMGLSSLVQQLLLPPKSEKSSKFPENLNLYQFKVIPNHRPWCLSKAHTQLPISH